MRVLLVGSGAREHALALAIAASPECEKLVVAPGNAGIAEVAGLSPVKLDDIDGLCALAQEMRVDLAVIGPEAPLAAGLADRLREFGVACFGPSAAAARIESSKAFSKAFMERAGIPTARWQSFSDAARAKAWARAFGVPLVVKASGLAAGKGVILPQGADEIAGAIDALVVLGGEIVVEERLEGEELSLIALCDGERYAVLPAAQDHKRLADGDRGPNTGGMGAYAPVCSMDEAEALARVVIAPVLRQLAEEGCPFVGALYAGLMLTKSGPKVLEYNARFGDPETQAILPLFATDLLPTLAACARGRLAEALPSFRNEHAACVVLASEGYPEHPVTGRSIRVGALPERAICLHAGTRLEAGKLVSAGGRVLSVVGMGSTRSEALALAYDAIENIEFEGAQFRRDIGARAEKTQAALRVSQSAYARSGVDIDAGNSAVELMKAAVQSTYGEEVIAGIGAFGGQFDASRLKSMRSPVLVSSTDGVGTKTSLGVALGRLAGLGQDMVNHSIDDILVQGATPLFFMDYIAASKLDPRKVAEIVRGMAEACRVSDCALLGGETAEMPGTYREGEMDIAGTIVGLAERSKLLPRADMAEGDIIIGLASSGLHTNGYSLARAIVASKDLEAVMPELGESLADALLRPHRSYLPVLRRALEAEPGIVKGLAHITGGGLLENIPRVLPSNLDAQIKVGSWKLPPLFALLQRWGNIEDDEMRRVFNLGIGMVAIIAPSDRGRFLSLLPEPGFEIGALVSGSGKVVFA